MSSAQVQLGSNGPQFSRIVAGMMRLNEWGMSTADLTSWLEACIDMGVTTFDHADIYGGYTCEAIFGQVLAHSPSLRMQMQLVTKCGIMLLSDNRPDNHVKHYNTTREHIIASAERSLQNLNTDYIDLLLVHRPDPLMDADEVASAFHTLKQDGKVRHFGVSNFTPDQFTLLQSRLNFALMTNQVEFSVAHIDPMYDGTFDLLQRHRLEPMIWSPLGGGGIFRADTAQTQRLNQTMRRIADKHNAGLDQIALAWAMAHPTDPLPVLGTGKIERVQAAVAAEAIRLDRQDWFAIWEASTGHEVP